MKGVLRRARADGSAIFIPAILLFPSGPACRLGECGCFTRYIMTADEVCFVENKSAGSWAYIQFHRTMEETNIISGKPLVHTSNCMIIKMITKSKTVQLIKETM
uniref:Uncharacterized protein n=1 Tax=Arundo donax TaxID=35708 RepID=A0A0A8YZG9_ARUDO